MSRKILYTFHQRGPIDAKLLVVGDLGPAHCPGGSFPRGEKIMPLEFTSTSMDAFFLLGTSCHKEHKRALLSYKLCR